MARVTSVVGRSRSSTSVLTETSISPQAPLRARKRVRSRVRPSLPTAWPTRFSSRAICSLAATMSLKVSAILPGNPVHDPGRRTEKSPCCICCRLTRMALKSAVVGSEMPAAFPLPAFEEPFKTVAVAEPATSAFELFRFTGHVSRDGTYCRSSYGSNGGRRTARPKLTGGTYVRAASRPLPTSSRPEPSYPDCRHHLIPGTGSRRIPAAGLLTDGDGVTFGRPPAYGARCSSDAEAAVLVGLQPESYAKNFRSRQLNVEFALNRFENWGTGCEAMFVSLGWLILACSALTRRAPDVTSETS